MSTEETANGESNEYLTAVSDAFNGFTESVSATVASMSDPAVGGGESSFTMPDFSSKPPPDVPDFSPFTIEATRVSDPTKEARGAGISALGVAVTPKASQDSLPYNTTPVRRRATDFAWLRAQLVESIPGVIVPPVPPCTAMTYIPSDDVVNGTALTDGISDLETFLRRLLMHNELKDAPELKVFCLAEPEVLAFIQTRGSYAPTLDTNGEPLENPEEPPSGFSSMWGAAGTYMEMAKELSGNQKEDATHLVTSPDDEVLAESKEWCNEQAAKLKDLLAKAGALKASHEGSMVDKAGMALDLHVAASIFDKDSMLGIKPFSDMLQLPRAGEGGNGQGENGGNGQGELTLATKPVPAQFLVKPLSTLLEKATDVYGYLLALNEAMDMREKRRLALQSAKLSLETHQASLGAKNAYIEKEKETEANLADVAEDKNAQDEGAVRSRESWVDKHKLTPEQEESAHEVFTMFDTDSTGEISSSELSSAFEAMGKKLTPAELSAMMAKVDSDSSGEISYEEFLLLVAPLIKGGNLTDANAILGATLNGFDDTYTQAAQASQQASLMATKYFNNAMASVQSGEEEVAAAEGSVEVAEGNFADANARLVRESAQFKASFNDRLKEVLVVFFQIEFLSASKQYDMLEKLSSNLVDVEN